MLPRPLRLDLRHLPDFFDRAEKQYGPLLSFRYLKPTTAVHQARWAIIVPKSVGLGVQRAQIKRRVRHALTSWLRQQSPDFMVPESVVVLVRAAATHDEYQQVFSTLLREPSL